MSLSVRLSSAAVEVTAQNIVIERAGVHRRRQPLIARDLGVDGGPGYAPAPGVQEKNIGRAFYSALLYVGVASGLPSVCLIQSS